jgi:hypothetical protein
MQNQQNNSASTELHESNGVVGMDIRIHTHSEHLKCNGFGNGGFKFPELTVIKVVTA